MEIIEVATKQEGTDTEYYSKAADYWENVTPTINGMLGQQFSLIFSWVFNVMLQEDLPRYPILILMAPTSSSKFC